MVHFFRLYWKREKQWGPKQFSYFPRHLGGEPWQRPKVQGVNPPNKINRPRPGRLPGVGSVTHRCE